MFYISHILIIYSKLIDGRFVNHGATISCQTQTVRQWWHADMCCYCTRDKCFVESYNMYSSNSHTRSVRFVAEPTLYLAAPEHLDTYMLLLEVDVARGMDRPISHSYGHACCNISINSIIRNQHSESAIPTSVLIITKASCLLITEVTTTFR